MFDFLTRPKMPDIVKRRSIDFEASSKIVLEEKVEEYLSDFRYHHVINGNVSMKSFNILKENLDIDSKRAEGVVMVSHNIAKKGYFDNATARDIRDLFAKHCSDFDGYESHVYLHRRIYDLFDLAWQWIETGGDVTRQFINVAEDCSYLIANDKHFNTIVAHHFHVGGKYFPRAKEMMYLLRDYGTISFENTNVSRMKVRE